MFDIGFGGLAGCVVAAILSWKRNEDPLWAIVAAIFGWAYVIYWVFTGGFDNGK